VHKVKKTRHLTIVIIAAAIVLGIGAVSAYATLGNDAAPPVTTSDVAASYVGDPVIHLTATDAEGVAYIYHRFDNGVVRLYTVGIGSATITAPTEKDQSLAPGTHALRFWAQDVNGNVEVQNTATFTVVSPKTVTSLKLKGRRAVVRSRQYFTLSGAITPGASCRVVVQRKKPGSSTWKTLAVRSTSASGAYSYRYRTAVKGTWSFRAKFAETETSLGSYSSIVKVRVK